MPIRLKNIFAVAVLLMVNTAAGMDLVIDAAKSPAKIQPTMYGLFFEDINFAADGGLYAELIKNRSFEFDKPLMGWTQPQTDSNTMNLQSGYASPINSSANGRSSTYMRIRVNNDKNYDLINEGFRGIGLHQGEDYAFSINAALGQGEIQKIIVRLIDENNKVLAETSITPKSKDWQSYTAKLTANETHAKAQLHLSFEGNGDIDIDMVSLFPVDTWKGRPGGLRKDLVQLLDDLDPGFLRFPGGCIVEGRTLAQRYQWKQTVGDVEDRQILISRWNEELPHKLAPDYYQSFGLGFFEYFQLAEDLGAEPLPILSCGIACQFNTGEIVPLGELDPYVQDALDLIEFANGSVDTRWGRLRADMGHPKPFNLTMIGIGNEQWGPDYIERLKAFKRVIEPKHPEITIVPGSGPFPDGPHFDYAMTELKKLDTKLIDEHYYKKTQWYLDNVTRYDNYDRNGPKVFVGEYAAQSVGVLSQDNKNNWETALAEAAFMTGLERNADIVTLTSYAPLLAHADAWQWAPDMIWFNNLSAYGTPNYYVQKLFSNNKGTDLMSISYQGAAVIGQNNLYSSAVKDSNAGQLIVKLVNVGDAPLAVDLNVIGESLSGNGSVITLTSNKLDDVNSFAQPQYISPSEKTLSFATQQPNIALGAHTVTVIRLGLK